MIGDKISSTKGIHLFEENDLFPSSIKEYKSSFSYYTAFYNYKDAKRMFAFSNNLSTLKLFLKNNVITFKCNFFEIYTSLNKPIITRGGYMVGGKTEGYMYYPKYDINKYEKVLCKNRKIIKNPV